MLLLLQVAWTPRTASLGERPVEPWLQRRRRTRRRERLEALNEEEVEEMLILRNREPV